MKDWPEVLKISRRQATRRFSLIFLSCTILLIGSFLTSCSSSLGVQHVSSSQPTRTFTVGAQAKLVVKSDQASIHIHAGDAGKMTVNARMSATGLDIGPNLDPKSLKVNTAQSGDTVTVDIQTDHTVIAGSKRFNIDITIPRTSTVETHSGAGDLDIKGVSGQLTLQASSGDIQASDVDGQITVQTNSGNINLDQAKLKGQSALKASSGTIRFTGTLDPQGSYQVQTSSGNVIMNLPASAAFSLQTSTHSGDVHNAFNSKEVGGEPRAKLAIQTSSGDITLKKEG
ncbi:hypothetical protein EPA93_02180 [Ktedonosporobacter rubrisoli]|uniref:DUF4097 domain-containing protein n=1 Tax=Ktedonosporobacter rubrisoli TaxID=2509675 RepID=A0A4P6JIG9_KTERU|nr:DUF4097 family beta strand repeat-containing protein [Ktedonosporobacter rubrisoli]QBD74864.1 hypothetical protein EPA93_02180 [Ktedonosporobacter rubrisoli]